MIPPFLISTLDTLPFASLVATEKPSLSIDAAEPSFVGMPLSSTGSPALTRPSLIVTLDTLPFSSLDVTEKPSLSIDVAEPASVGIPFASTGAPNVPMLAVTLPSGPLSLTWLPFLPSPSVTVSFNFTVKVFTPLSLVVDSDTSILPSPCTWIRSVITFLPAGVKSPKFLALLIRASSAPIAAPTEVTGFLDAGFVPSTVISNFGVEIVPSFCTLAPPPIAAAIDVLALKI